MPVERSECSDGCVTSKACIPLDLVPGGVGAVSPVNRSFRPFVCLSPALGTSPSAFCLCEFQLLSVSHTALVLNSPTCQCRRCGFSRRVTETPWRREQQTHSRILAWGAPCTEEPGGLQPMASQRETSLSKHAHTGVSHSVCPFVTGLEVHQCFDCTCCSL